MTSTPLRAIRVGTKLWIAVQKKAYKEGTTVSAVIVEALEAYISRK